MEKKQTEAEMGLKVWGAQLCFCDGLWPLFMQAAKAAKKKGKK